MRSIAWNWRVVVENMDMKYYRKISSGQEEAIHAA